MSTEPAVVLPWHGREPSRPRALTDADWLRLERHASEILAALGMDLDTPGTRETPMRFLRALHDATAGYDGDPKLLTTFPAEHHGVQTGLIVEGPIAFHALCEHHVLPFHGVAHVAYVADREIIGISKLTRIVRLYARRFTVQERIGEQIADTLADLIGARGVAVHLDAAHLCTQMRGVSEHGSHTVTTFWRGVFADDADLRHELLLQIR